ncbi:MAG TPA: ATP-binding protein [Streptosporangiaceae bacterium]|nr:ATP-binding protein [Streptosporangiaceae bacterium]
MGANSGIGGGAGGPWYRVEAIMAGGPGGRGGSAEQDYASVLPAVLNAAMYRRPFVAGWLSRGGGAPLELITNAGPLPEPAVPDPPRVSQIPGSSTQDRPYSRSGPDDPSAPLEPSRVIDPSRVIGPGRSLEPAGAVDAGGVFEPRELLFPWGARGVPMSGGLLADLDRLVWAPCPGRQASLFGWDAGQPGWDVATAYQSRVPSYGLAGRRGGDDQGDRRPTLFESALVTLMTRSFGWLVVAEPSDHIDTEIAELRTQLNVLRRYDEERSRYDVGRAERRLAELDAFREAGLWNVRVLVGAGTEQELRLIAPMLVGSIDLGAHPYRLRSAEEPRDLADALAARLADPVDGAQVPFAATAGALVALTGLPRGEVPGVRVLEPGVFDVTSETMGAHGDGQARAGNQIAAEPADGSGPRPPVTGDQSIELGAILDGQERKVGTFRVPLATLNRHAFVTGATGSGKSQTVRHLLEQLTEAGVPWLAVEPVKSEYAAMAGRIAGAGQVTVINPSDTGAIPLSVNPLEPEPGYPVQAHIDMVRALFLAAFDAREPFPQIISQALQRAYEDCGWDPVTGAGRPGAPAGPAVPTIAQLQRAALDVIEDVGYGRELRADVRGFVDVRLRSLRTGSAGRFFEGGHPADIAELLRRNVVLAIEDVANDEDKAFLIGTLIIRLVEHLRLRARTAPVEGLAHVIVIEEAHRLLRASREGASAHAVELFASLLAEIRAYGEGIIVVEQIPAKLVPDVVKNTALKVLHRLPAQDDREVVGAAMNLDDDQSRQVVSLRPGVAAVFADGMDRPLRIRVPYGGARERAGKADPAPTRGRRSAACGPSCMSGRACSLLELRAADLLAAEPEDAWLRIWTEALVLAFLTNRALPVVPAALRSRWADLDRRLRECLLATAVDRSMRGRSLAVRAYYEPRRLAAEVASTALKLLDGHPGAGAPAGREWVIPQLQWLHEVERACPFGSAQPDPFAPAPPLDYLLAGLADRPGLKIGQRVSNLRRHPLSMELSRNRQPAWTVLLGEDEQRGFADDLAAVVIGVSHRGQLRQAAGEMGIVGWLEAVLSWPRRFIVGAEDQVSAAAPSPGAAATGAGSG